MSYDIGDVVRLTTTFAIDDTPTDTDAVLTVRAPDGTTSTPAITHGTDGVYTADVVPDMAGTWVASWSGTEGVTTAEPLLFRVRRDMVIAP